MLPDGVKKEGSNKTHPHGILNKSTGNKCIRQGITLVLGSNSFLTSIFYTVCEGQCKDCNMSNTRFKTESVVALLAGTGSSMPDDTWPLHIPVVKFVFIRTQQMQNAPFRITSSGVAPSAKALCQQI